MAGLMDTIEQRTEMVGQNRMEMLLFRLAGRRQLYGLNVFKIQEILHCPRLTRMPRLQKEIIGVASIRDFTVSVIDLSLSMGGPKTVNYEDQLLVMTEYNNSLQGFVVAQVERIVDLGWEHIKPPPRNVGHNVYLTAISEYHDEIVEIIDVEKILSEINHDEHEIADKPEDVKSHIQSILKPGARVLVADDSKIALKQTANTVRSLGVEVIEAHSGLEALEILRQHADAGKIDEIELLLSDVEMPGLDGYSLSATLRKDPLLKEVYVILHTSLSGVFNESMLKRAGANDFIPKFNPDELSKTVINAIEAIHAGIKVSEAVMHSVKKPDAISLK